MPELPTLYTFKQAAEYLVISERQLRRLVKARSVPFYRIGTLIRFSESDLISYLKSSRLDGKY